MSRNSAFQPEVCASTAPELDHDPRAFPPELATRIEDIPPEVSLPLEQEPRNEKPRDTVKGSRLAFRGHKTQYVAGLIILAIIIAVVGGSLGGTLGRKSRSTTVSTQPSPPTAQPSTSSSQLPPSSSSLPNATHSILANSSVATASCINGERWLFSQDNAGNIRGAQYLSATSEWNFKPGVFNFTSAKLGTSLGASCVNLTTDVLQYSILSPGIYLERFADSPTFTKPDDSSKICVSSVIVPRQSFYNDTIVIPSFVSSAAVYQYNFSIGATNIAPDDNLLQARHNPINLATFFEGQGSITYINEGFTCSYNYPDPTNSSQLYSQFYFGNIGPLNNILVESLLWTYDLVLLNSNTTVNSTGINKDGSALPSALTQDQSLYGTDIALALLPENRNAVIYLQPNHTIGLDVRGSAFATALNQSPSSNQSTWPAQIPFNRISATALATDPSIVLVYYQTSNTTLAEISFNFTSGMWGPSPVNIEIP